MLISPLIIVPEFSKPKANLSETSNKELKSIKETSLQVSATDEAGKTFKKSFQLYNFYWLC